MCDTKTKDTTRAIKRKIEQTHKRPANVEPDQTQKRKPNQKYIMMCESIYGKCRRLESFRFVIGGRWISKTDIPLNTFSTKYSFCFILILSGCFRFCCSYALGAFLLYSIGIYKSVKLFEFDSKTHFRRDISFLS